MTTPTKAAKTKKAPKKKKEGHVVWKPPNSLACLHCGESYEVNMPAPVDVLAAAGRAFDKMHKKCPAPKTGPACTFCLGLDHATAHCPRTQYGGDFRRWAEGPDQGISSIAICKRLMPKDARGQVEFKYNNNTGFGTYPADPSDFGRCHRLLHAIPGWRARIGEMKAESKIWANLVEHWDELEALYREELPTMKCPKLYARMKELGA